MRILILFAWLAASLSPPAALAAPQADLWERWERHGAGAEISHGAWGEFLQKYRKAQDGQDGVALLDYAGVSAADKTALDDYIAMLAAAPVDEMTRAQQLAFWINLYNALTVQVVLDNYPVDSIREISDGFFATGPWDRKLLEVAGEMLSLNDIEHRILRPIWRDARIHYAVNCASIGCPNLAAAPYTADAADAMLDAAARGYVNSARGAAVEGGRLVVSSIYEWFAVDFGGTDAAIIAHLREYAAPPLQTALAGVEEISGDEYDWALNSFQ